jgi:hypothetical protein
MKRAVACRSARNADNALQLYGADGYHPSALGTFLAALEIYERLSGRDARSPAQNTIGTNVERCQFCGARRPRINDASLARVRVCATCVQRMDDVLTDDERQ